MAHTEAEEREIIEDLPEHSAHHDSHGGHGNLSATLATKEQAHQNKHHRQMHRTLRWPIHSNTPRITF
jgi:hypothetical protein